MARSRYTNDELVWIFDRTDGRCHICHGPLCLSNYARSGSRGAWEVEHSRCRASGGSDYLRNLYAAHIPCNRGKGTRSTRSARAAYGKTRAPMSALRKKGVREKRAVGGALTAGTLGFALGGPPGALIGAVLGGVFGHELDPE